MKLETSGAVSEVNMYQALQKASSALLDWRTSSKGRAAFARRMEKEITKRRDEIYENENEEKHPLVACYQIALKELWNKADQNYWETQGMADPDDIYR